MTSSMRMARGFRNGCAAEFFHDQLGCRPGRSHSRSEKLDAIVLGWLTGKGGPQGCAKRQAEFRSDIEFLDPALTGEIATHC